MDITSTLRALQALCSTSAQQAQAACPGVLLHLERLCLALFIAIGKLVSRSTDPRLILAHGELIEKFAQQVHHEQLSVAVLAESTGAHALSLETYDELREGNCDFQAEPERASGRTCYLATPDLLSGWLGINYFEAQRRIADAHLLIARRNPDGSRTTARFTHLAGLYATGKVDRRTVARVARRLEKLEPADTVFDGVPCPPTATAADGRLLEEHAASALAHYGSKEAHKQINMLLKEHRQRTKTARPPKLGLFVGRECDGTQEFILRTSGADTQMMLSVIAQADNPRTQASKTASLAAGQQQENPATDPSPATELSPQDSAQEQPDPAWLTSDSPMPQWAQPTDQSPESETAKTPSAEQDLDTAQASTASSPASAPASETDSSAENTEPQNSLDAAERRLNALMNIIAAPASGGVIKPVVPKVVVYMWLSELEDLATSHAVTANGVQLSPGQLRRVLANCKILPVVLNGRSLPVDVGRAQRYFHGSVRTLVMARDRGCLVPGCTTPPDLVEIDHYQRSWAEGGETSVENGAAVCPAGHHSRHVGHLKIVNIEGLPHVILPKHLDPEQKPRRNTYWGALQLWDADKAKAKKKQSKDKPETPEPTADAD